MSDKVFCVPDGLGTSGTNFDPNLLLSMMNNGGMGGGNWMWIIFLFFLYGWGGNGGGLFGNRGNGTGESYLASQAERDLLLQAVGGNGNAISSLANTLNTDIQVVLSAISNVQSAIQNVGNQVGLSGQQVINSIQSGNQAIASQMALCCCNVREAITNGNYQNQINTINQVNGLSHLLSSVNNSVERGFCNSAYETQAQTCLINQNICSSTQNLKDATTTLTNAIIAKLDQMLTSALQDKINSLTEAKSTLMTLLNNEHLTALVAQMLAPIQGELNAIKAALPSTTVVTYPNLVGVPAAYLYNQFGQGYNGFGQFWG